MTNTTHLSPEPGSAREALTGWLVASLFTSVQLAFCMFGLVLLEAGRKTPGNGLGMLFIYLFMYSAVAGLVALGVIFRQNGKSDRSQIAIGLGFSCALGGGLAACIALFHEALSTVTLLEWLWHTAQCAILFAVVVALVRLSLLALIPRVSSPQLRPADIATDTFG